MNSEKKEWENVIEIPADGKSGMIGGAWTIAFVYSNQGNFILKGYGREIDEYLEKRKRKGLKYFMNRSMYGSKYGRKLNRNFWSFYKDTVKIREPYFISGLRFNKGENKWAVVQYDSNSFWDRKEIWSKEFKRLPNRWIKEFNNL